MSDRYRVITTHLFRRSARKEKGSIERLLTRQTPESEAELRLLGVDPVRPLRVSPGRWKGFWRVEQMR